MGMARKTPIRPVQSVNVTTTHHGVTSHVCSSVAHFFSASGDRPGGGSRRSTNAPNIVAMVDPVEYPAADAVDAMQAFSRIVIWLMLLPEQNRTKFHITNDRTHAVI